MSVGELQEALKQYTLQRIEEGEDVKEIILDIAAWLDEKDGLDTKRIIKGE